MTTYMKRTETLMQYEWLFNNQWNQSFLSVTFLLLLSLHHKCIKIIFNNNHDISSLFSKFYSTKFLIK